MSRTEHPDRVVFATPYQEKKGTAVHISYGMMLITPVRMILIPASSLHSPSHEESLAEQLTRQRPGDASRQQVPDPPPFLGRDAGEILLEEQDARTIPLGEIAGIEIRRVRNGARTSRWLAVLFGYSVLAPPGAGYSVDYELTIMTQAGKDILTTPFSLDLKQVLVKQLGNRVHEIVDEYAPLL